MMELFAKATGKTAKEMSLYLDRRMFMNASQALKFGLIDSVVKLSK
jgi:ATP-dependent protease ClpP protease subunit